MNTESGTTTVVTVVYSGNSLGSVKENVESVLEHTDDLKDFVIVMNGVQGNVRRYLWSEAGRKLPVKLVDFKRNLGLATGLNAGIALASGDVIVTLASDVKVLGRWLEKDWTETLREVLGRGYDVVSLSYNRHDDVEFFKKMNFWCPSLTCCAYRRSVFEEVGTYDELYDPYGFEDEDMGMRLHLAGKKVACVTGGVFPIYHPEPAYGDGSTDSISDHKLKHNESGAEKFIAKWGRLDGFVLDHGGPDTVSIS